MTEASGSNANQPKSCAGTRRDGSPCGVRMLADDAYCFAHSPGRQQERDEARRKGGQGRSAVKRTRALMPARLVGVWDQLELAMSETYDGTLDPRRATAMGSLARAMVAVLSAGELEARLRALEEKGA